MRKAVVALLPSLAMLACGGGVTGPSAPTTAPTAVTAPAPSAAPAPTPDPAGQTLTGVWRGALIETIKGCVQDHALQLDLTQSGSNLSGSGVAVVGPRACNDVPGASFPLTVSGSASAAAVLMRVVNVKPGVGGYADLRGTVSGNTMGGTFLTDEGDTGTWSVTR